MSADCGHTIRKMDIISDIRLRTQHDYFDYQFLTGCLSKYKKPRDKISSLLAHGDIVRIKKGLYIFGGSHRRQSLSTEILANLIFGPSYISLDYALSHHGLIPERVETLTSVTTGRTRSFDTPVGAFSYQFLPLPKYAIGAHLKEGNQPFLIASMEKALVDKVWTDKRFSGTNRKDFFQYLEEDLRIELDHLSTLDAGRLHDIDKAYNSRKIHLLVRFLLEYKE
jgi:predicted transcriptional regulator of viral defense system